MTALDLPKPPGWTEAAAERIPADAGDRRYTRLSRPDGARAVLMQALVAASAQAAAQFAAFRRIGLWLRDLGLGAPAEIWVDAERGLLLLEDLGPLSFAALLDAGDPAAETAYASSVDVLAHVAGADAPCGLDAPGPETLAAMIAPTLAALPGDVAEATGLAPALSEALTDLSGVAPVVALRDVHAENLIWRADRTGLARVGLLDFQDALLLPDGYDLASLLDDPRREVPLAWRAALIDRYAGARGMPAAAMAARVDLLSLLRNLRIHGIFRRLETGGGRPRYARFQPRVRALIARTVARPGLGGLRDPVRRLLDATAHWEAAVR
jgi:aminoglycoside/choline kinase family phosphotransferase